MDGSMNISPETAQSLQNLSNKDKQELNQFITHESTDVDPASESSSTDISVQLRKLRYKQQCTP